MIVVRFQLTGFHNWPNAEGERAYLAQRHRHQFHFEIETAVTHDDREIEFHDLIREATRTCFNEWPTSEDGIDFGAASCERIAATLGLVLAHTYKRPFSVSVFEDGEAGARVGSPYSEEKKSRPNTGAA